MENIKKYYGADKLLPWFHYRTFESALLGVTAWNDYKKGRINHGKH